MFFLEKHLSNFHYRVDFSVFLIYHNFMTKKRLLVTGGAGPRYQSFAWYGTYPAPRKVLKKQSKYFSLG